MRKHLLLALALFVTAMLAVAGCSEAPAPNSSSPPPAQTTTADTTAH